MNVYLPYSYVHQPTIDALIEHVGSFCCLKMDYDEAYFDHFNRLWLSHKGLINVEHDVVIRTGQVASLLNCRGNWCSYPEKQGGPPSLSLVKFSPDFVRLHPTVWRWIQKTKPNVHWSHLDVWVQEFFADIGVKPCLHGPPYADNRRPKGVLH